ncbi:MAG: YidC/Oxa1 family membrane protein insertase [bacterium]|nr:YidC/Oxa1 family membrane protein insertase [bacterium]MBU1428847.1 YidC/Oxa1 family membrane protein insertase [bacterium]MBU2439672.1 YidC/Oxa1 family membrane protein insertase [bacterium]
MWSSLITLVTKLLTVLYGFTHNYGVAIILLTILIRLILYPLMQKQMVSMREMQKIQPLMKAVQEKYKNDKERLNKELMALYKEHKVNPMSGCLPLLIQMPILILLFQTLRVFEYLDPITNNVAGGFLWIANYYNVIENGDLVAKAGLALSERLIPFGFFGIEYIGILPFLVAGSMYIQQKMTSTDGTTGKDGGSAQQTQKMMTIMMPLLIGFMSFSLPSGLTLYWFTSTLLGIGQQHLINKKTPTIVDMPKEAVSDKGELKEKQLNKKPKEVLAPKEESWIPGYEGVDGGNPSGRKTKTKKYKKGKRR